MKILLTYSLLVLVLLTFSYKTIHHCFKLNDSFIMIADDMDCEEKKSESKKSDNKNDKEFHDYFVFNKGRALSIIYQSAFSPHTKLLYASSGFGHGVFFPPDFTAK